MSGLIKWKKVLPFTLALGIIGLFGYGVGHTITSFGDIQQSQSGGILVSNISTAKDGLNPVSPICNPLGCAACGGCVTLQYGQNVTSVPDSSVQIVEY
jgi:hypothetical protein